MKNLLLAFAFVFAFGVFSFGQKAHSENVQKRMTQVELLGHPIGTKTVIERTTWIYRTGPGDQTLEEPHHEITVSDFLENGQLYLKRGYRIGYPTPLLMEHHVRIGDREGIVLEPLKDLAVVNEKTVPAVAPYRIPKGTNTAAMGITRYTHDRFGRIVEVKRLKPDGKWIETKSYKYDHHGRVIERIERSIFDDQPIVITYKYDLQGQLAETYIPTQWRPSQLRIATTSLTVAAIGWKELPSPGRSQNRRELTGAIWYRKRQGCIGQSFTMKREAEGSQKTCFHFSTAPEISRR